MGPLFQIGFFSGAPGPGELILVFLVVLLLFGPRKLPGLARTLGSLMQQVRRASNDFRDQLMSVEEDMKEGVRTAVDDYAGPRAADMADAPKDVTDVEVTADEDDPDEEERPLAG
ncbi:MAG: twin-arginine translocase TatA/TatE family subunit [Kiritimatiellia bacterium]|jgi:sec-independent protein translocase protein TatB|nr:twin-arginine translocase TatA/TatE family subunit [Kiritimatiellia bacterium]MDP6631523.1 twin-arginine translocase TatA/TatE family subunit [Kiritimatiellia bacterium]MDP6810583.1 twin-arginine translocase TatA/TatE family subunit [Kiritimatiellia bacterium]MDP7022830.1 twin-arginine translocase TatA/TatE family subunit [Kiritimatiellia bacterium]